MQAKKAIEVDLVGPNWNVQIDLTPWKYTLTQQTNSIWKEILIYDILSLFLWNAGS